MDSETGNNPGRMERKKEKTRQKIVMTAMDLFRQNGIDATTMEQIAESVDIAKGTLYNYFPVKEAIISEFMQLSFEEKYSERAEALGKLPDTRARIKLILGELIGGIQTQSELFEKYFVYRIRQMISLRPLESEASGMYLLGMEIIRLGQKDGEIRQDIPMDVLEGFFEFIFVEVAQLFYKDPAHFDADRAIESCVDLFMHGVKPAAGVW